MVFFCVIQAADFLTFSILINKMHLVKYKKHFFLNNQPDPLIIQIYSVIKLYMFRASSLPIIRSFLLYLRNW